MLNPTPTVFLPYHALDNVIMRGTRAAQPLPTKVTPGSLYNVVEEALVERSNGVAWESYSSSPEVEPVFYTHTQSTPATTWVITHNLGAVGYPVTITNAAGAQLIPDSLVYTSENVTTATFALPQAGFAYVSGGGVEGPPGPPGTGGGGGGGETDLNYVGPYAPGTYNDGDIVVGADGIAYLCVKSGVTTPPEPWSGGGVGKHRVTHEPGGSDEILALNASSLTSGVVPDARLSSNVPLKNAPNTFGVPQTFNDAIITNAESALIRPDTVDGADTKGVIVCGGGGAAGARGAYVWVRGNENAFEPGGITLASSQATITGLVTNPPGGASRRGSVVAASATDVALFTCDATDQVALYMVRAGLGTSSQDAPNYGAFATVVVEGSSARIVPNNATNCLISLSGLSVMARQTSGVAQTIKWCALKIV